MSPQVKTPFLFSAWFQALPLWWRHAWADARGSGRVLPQASLARIEAHVAQGERTHSGQIRVCVETHLPRSYLWRFVRHGTPLANLIQQRALMLFSKLRVWDTPLNNGVLIHVLLAERAIHVVADRGVNACVSPDHWLSVIAPMQSAFAQGAFETGLLDAVDAVSATVALYFPRAAKATGASQGPEGDVAEGEPSNSLPDAPVIG